MCGIAALLDPAGGIREDAERAVAETLRHRGPDGEGFARCCEATLIHRRLAITDLETGDQPLYSEDRECVVVVNGELSEWDRTFIEA